MADELKVAPATKGAPAPVAAAPKRPIEAWMAEKAIAGYVPGTINHKALMAGVHMSLGRVEGLELTEAQFDDALVAFLATPIGYTVQGKGPATEAAKAKVRKQEQDHAKAIADAKARKAGA
jgi:hypothetical protein